MKMLVTYKWNSNIKYFPSTISVADMVGCFPMPRTQISPLKKPPQPPETVDTKFLLLTRASLSTNSSHLLKYGDNQKSLIDADFNYSLPTKLIVHGFKGSGQDRGALDISTALLELVGFHFAIGPSLAFICNLDLDDDLEYFNILLFAGRC